MPLPAGTKLDSFEIINPVGAGGMGEMFRARDTTLKRDVAIKVLPALREGRIVERFSFDASSVRSMAAAAGSFFWGFVGHQS
jgi:eukaryotic-like serine/threonine-protein kinase